MHSLSRSPRAAGIFFQPQEALLFGLEGGQELEEPPRGQETGKELGRGAQADGAKADQ